jgi:hypothetical protein
MKVVVLADDPRTDWIRGMVVDRSATFRNSFLFTGI